MSYPYHVKTFIKNQDILVTKMDKIIVVLRKTFSQFQILVSDLLYITLLYFFHVVLYKRYCLLRVRNKKASLLICQTLMRELLLFLLVIVQHFQSEDKSA